MRIQKCRICKRDLDLSAEYWFRNSKSASGYQSICKACDLARRKIRRQKANGVSCAVPKSELDDGYNTEADIMERDLSEKLRDKSNWPLSLSDLSEQSDEEWDIMCDKLLKGA